MELELSVQIELNKETICFSSLLLTFLDVSTASKAIKQKNKNLQPLNKDLFLQPEAISLLCIVSGYCSVNAKEARGKQGTNWAIILL